MPDARCTRGPVCKMGKENAHEHTGSAEALRHSLRNGFTDYFELSPENRACLPPSPLDMTIRARSGRRASEDLTPTIEASGPHDFTVRGQHRSSARRLIAHGPLDEPALPSRFTPDAAASTASRPASMTMANAPLWDRTGRVLWVIWGRGQA